MSTNRTRKDKGRVGKAKLPKGKNGRNLCRYCETEVPKNRKTFCSTDCVHEWKIRTQPAYVRVCVLKRDDGICAQCKRDAIILSLELQILKRKDHAAWLEWHKVNGVSCARTSMWDADHIESVSEGGGECGLSGYQTLCILCHNSKTKKAFC